MAGLLQGLSEGLQGGVQGFGQGLTLYDEMTQMADRQEARGRRKQAETEVQDLINKGAAQGDPYEFADNMSQIYLRNGDMENYDKFQSKAMQFRAVKADNIAHQAFMSAGTNPMAAIPLMNEWSQLTGNNMKWDAQTLPGGGFRIAVNGQPTDYKTKEEAHMAMADTLERFALKPEDYAKAANERAKASETARHNLTEEGLAERKGVADIAASGASALASRAAAGKYGEQAVTERQGREAKIGADVALANQREQDTIVNAVDKLTPDPVEPGTYDLASDQSLHTEMTTALMNAGVPSPVVAIGLSQSLAAQPKEAIGAMHTEGGVWHLPGGQQLPDTPELSNAIARLVRAAGVEPEEE